jgi:hypothetical protein
MMKALTISIETIASCFEGIIPSSICTVAADGTPNVTYLSVIQLVDSSHVALSRQFFNKTDQYTVSDTRAQLQVVEPETGRRFRLDVTYDRTETEGPLFERMRTRLDSVASQEGMSDIFRLSGTDICTVQACELVPCDFPEAPSERRDPGLGLVHEFSERIAAAGCLDDLLDTALKACGELFDYRHGFVMFADETGRSLYTVASRGFEESGAGSEVPVGKGLLGTVAARRMTVLISNVAKELVYSHAIRDTIDSDGAAEGGGHEIPLPGLPKVMSQVAAPLLAFRELIGVLCFQSEERGHFRVPDEHLAAILASHLGVAIALLRDESACEEEETGPAVDAVQVKHYCEDDSVFLDNEYLIKGVAGRILWRLLQCYVNEGRVEFSNKELRLDASLDLPDIKDNLEARLILLARRLSERVGYIAMERTARGRFHLHISRDLVLAEVPDPSATARAPSF